MTTVNTGDYGRILALNGACGRAALFALRALHKMRVLAIGGILASSVAAADDLTRPVQVSANGHFLQQPDGAPFFWLADTGWALFARLDRDEADLYLQDRAHKGFTVIQAVAWGGPWDSSMMDRNRYGDLPLIKGDPSRPNPRYFDFIDWVVGRAARYGLRMAILPTWGIATISGQNLYTLKSAETYGRWLGARYRGKGVIWVLGGDMIPVSPAEPHKKGSPLVDHRPVYDAMAKGIREGDGGHPLITYHPCGVSFSGTAEPRTSLYFHDRDWLDVNMLQSSHFRDPSVFFKLGFDFGWNATFNYQPVGNEYRSTPVRPVIDGETRYEDEPVDVFYESQKGYWTAYDSRNAAYHAVFAGAAGHTYGDNSVHQFYDPKLRKPDEWVKSPWQVELNAPGAQQMHHVKDLMLSRPYFSRIPDQSVIVGETGEGSAHVSGTRDKSGSYMMVYLPEGQPVTIDMVKVSGTTAVAWWYDPRTGMSTKVADSVPTNGQQRFVPPSSGSEDDWVLVLDDAGTRWSAPGTAEAG